MGRLVRPIFKGTEMENSNDYPRMLFKAGGPEQAHGGQFSTLIVGNADEHETALAEGWANTTPEALEIKQAAEQATTEDSSAVGDRPATRDELEQKASELDIPYSARVSDKKLAEAIAAKLAELSS
jgi:hypothetical protein